MSVMTQQRRRTADGRRRRDLEQRQRTQLSHPGTRREYDSWHRGGEVTEPQENGMGQLARFLGWFSLGLGTALVAAPGLLGDTAGVGDHPKVLRAVGLREIAAGVGLLTQGNAPWGWARVGGDAVDLMLLGAALRADDSNRTRAGVATALVGAITFFDVIASLKLRDTAQQPGLPVDVRRAVTINRDADDLYRFWHNFENLPHFMEWLQSVRVMDPRRSHWVVRAPAGMKVEWDAEIVSDRPNEEISWRALPGATIQNSGTVRFERDPAGRGTRVVVDLQYQPPAGQLGRMTSKLFGQDPERLAQEGLRRFKQIMETGEIPTTEGQPSGGR